MTQGTNAVNKWADMPHSIAWHMVTSRQRYKVKVILTMACLLWEHIVRLPRTPDRLVAHIYHIFRRTLDWNTPELARAVSHPPVSSVVLFCCCPPSSVWQPDLYTFLPRTKPWWPRWSWCEQMWCNRWSWLKDPGSTVLSSSSAGQTYSEPTTATSRQPSRRQPATSSQPGG